ncbi:MULTISPECIES: VOC family protein [Arthrobacter]|uniref:VOC family protein n=1 Tax=Arthrobacter caoxuetaonis TaxID=2886935 RepID=A0A9X1MFJ9_9MICC|nr:VOC family protein [Arthrobacter caoxuetaonis]MCC3283665.1 VOC family protein [Arthrobacter caoxuetaonis]MCC3299193.1 VOC family protein [Arthrobacter caoxuetaonis]MCC9193103.1 VOC family protein [Arthrobacter sp. zg-Y916]USQ58483.1 VOC family protein [Arthrobacter caoxuetaonis]
MDDGILAFGISLNVPDPGASAGFLTEHFGFRPEMQDEGFISLKHPDGGPNIVFLRTGLPTFKPAEIAGRAGDGLLLVLVVGDLDERHAHLAAAGADVVTPPETEPWGERYAQYRDPNGLIIQLVQWV